MPLMTNGRSAHRLFIRVSVPQILDDLHAAVLEVCGHRIFILIDRVLLECFFHQLCCLGLHVGLDERTEVLVCITFRADVLTNDLACDARLDRVVVELVNRHLNI